MLWDVKLVVFMVPGDLGRADGASALMSSAGVGEGNGIRRKFSWIRKS